MADAQASGACGRKIVWVQVPSPAFFFYCLSFKNASAFLLRDARHAMHDILLLRISAILPEAISDVGLTPTIDTDLLLATYRGGSHLTSDIYINTKCCILPQIFELILSNWNKQNTGNVNRYKL